LLARYAEVMTAGARLKVGPVAADPEVEKMRLELERQKVKFEIRQAEVEKEKAKKQDVLERERLAFKRHEKEKQLELDKQRNELEKIKAKSKKQKWITKNALKKVQSEKKEARQNDGAVSAKKYADAIRESIVPMGLDPIDAVAFFQRAEKLFVSYGVPKELQANLIGPYLNQKSKQIWARLSPEVTSVYDDVKEAIFAQNEVVGSSLFAAF